MEKQQEIIKAVQLRAVDGVLSEVIVALFRDNKSAELFRDSHNYVNRELHLKVFLDLATAEDIEKFTGLNAFMPIISKVHK